MWKPYTEDTANYVTGSQTSSNTSYYQLLTTGASDQTAKMNIYDFAGNGDEWTLEKGSYAYGHGVIRGGQYCDSSIKYPANNRYDISHYQPWIYVVFRGTLY